MTTTTTTTRHTGNETTIEEYHLKYGRPMLKCLIEEINEAFQTNDFPVLDAFHAIDPRYFHKIAESSRGTLLDTLYDWYGKSKVDVFENLHNEASALIKCQRNTFHQEYKDYTSFISRKIEQQLKEAEVELRNAEKELRLLQSRKKSRARDIKVAEKKLKHKKNCLDNPVTVEIAHEWSTEVFPNIALLLEIILVCASSGAVVERGFSVMNLAMNKLHEGDNSRCYNAYTLRK